MKDRSCPVLLFFFAFASGAPALEVDAVRVRVSVKLVLSSSGALPEGGYDNLEEITRVFGKCNDALRRSGANWTLILTELKSTQAASGFYSISAGQVGSLEDAAKANKAGYLWRDDAINIYVVDRITDAGGVCSFPPGRETIVINSRGLLGGSEGWLHEVGHYFNLIHTHEGDAVADTISDPGLPDPFDCNQHDQNFLQAAQAAGASAADVQNVLHNVMSYHCDPTILTPLQVVRMKRALLDYRLKVLEPQPEDPPPVAEIRLPPEAAGGAVPLTGSAVSVELDGSSSHDGRGGEDIVGTWSLVSGPAGGWRFEGPARGWSMGQSGFGYGDDDDLTELTDMRNRYLAVYLTRAFELTDPSRLRKLELDITYDDGFAAYLNGTEVARQNLAPGAGPASPALASVEARQVIDLTPFLGALRTGRNRLSIEVHNQALDSSDLSLHPILRGEETNGTARTLIPSRAVWRYRKGSEGAPPAAWKSPEFDPGVSRMRVSFTLPGTYRFRLTVDDGLPPLNLASAEAALLVTGNAFRRGDCNGDGALDLSDPLQDLLALFSSGGPLPCPDACDANDDENLDLSDALALLDYLFRQGPAPPPPFPAAGSDPSGTALGCDS